MPAGSTAVEGRATDDRRSWTDSQLFAGLGRRDRAAYAELYRRHASSVRAAARMILGRRAECDDVVADVFIALWTSPDLFDPSRGSLVGFLRLKAKGRSIDIMRSEASRRRREERGAPRADHPHPDVESVVLAGEVRSELGRAITALSEPEQEVIRLAYFGDMTYRAVAAYLDEPEGTVKSRIRVALQRLRVHTGELRSA